MTLLPMENKESILCALKCFEKEKPANIPPILDDYIKQVAKNGQTMLPWIHVKPLMLCKYNKVMDSFLADYSSDFLQISPNTPVITELRSRVYNTIKRLNGIPFTIQRLCELLENPFRHYTKPDKFLRGLEKVLMVVSTVDPQGNKIHQEDPRFPSQAGIEECSMIINDALMSPPSSPTIGNLSRQNTSKSSDEEVTEDENGEDNEDEEEEEEEEEEVGYHEGTDESIELNHADDVSTLGDENPTHSSSLERTTTSIWDSETKAIASDQTSVSSPSVPGAKHDSDQLDDELGDLPGESHISRDKESFTNRAPSAVGSDDDTATDLSAPNLTSAEDLSADMEHCEMDMVKSIDTGSKSEGSKILRPIGQLEAFVQNMAANVPSGIGSSLSTTVASQSETGATNLFSGSEAAVSQPGSETMEGDPCSLISPQKRRASDSLHATSITNSPVTCAGSTLIELVSSDALQSPVKRRRICSSREPNHAVSGSETSSSFPNSLNNSPPIILCNPNRDRESGECLTCDTLSTPADGTASDHTPAGLVGHSIGHANNAVDEATDVSQDALNVGGGSTIRIDMETGEEEGDIQNERSESALSDAPAPASDE